MEESLPQSQLEGEDEGGTDVNLIPSDGSGFSMYFCHQHLLSVGIPRMNLARLGYVCQKSESAPVIFTLTHSSKKIR